jgi:hypothetical protein
MTTKPVINYAGGYSVADATTRHGVIATAPAWAQRMARETYQRLYGAKSRKQAPATRNPKRSPAILRALDMAGRLRGLQSIVPKAERSKQSAIGWVAGMAAPGLSVPVYSERDAERLPEQLTPECWQHILRDIKAGTRVNLTLGHYGKVLASTPLDLMFRLHGVFGMGLRFSARLNAGTLPAAAANALLSGGCGVSIGFGKPKGWVTERSGIGRVRVINECVLEHIAIIVPGGGQKAAYAGARCYGFVGERFACPQTTIDKAESFAYRELKRQAGCRS